MRKILQFVCQHFDDRKLFELDSLASVPFSKCPEVTGVPSFYNQDKLTQALWPRPDKKYRVFIQVE